MLIMNLAHTVKNLTRQKSLQEVIFESSLLLK